MRRFRMILGIVVASLVLQGGVAFSMQPAEPKPVGEGTERRGAVAGSVAHIASELKAMQQKYRAQRLEILKQVEKGELTAEDALEKLDRVPKAPGRSQRPGERAWIRLHVRQGENEEVEFALPLSVVLWVIEEGPKLVPSQVADQLKQQSGMDLRQIDLSSLAGALESLGQVQTEVTLLHVKQGKQEVHVTIEPEPGQAE